MLSPNGKRKYLSGRTRQEVTAKLARATRTVAVGVPLPPERLTIATYLARWLEEAARPRLKPSTFRSYEQLTRVHIVPALGHHHLAKLEPQHVQDFLNAKASSGLSSRTVQYLRAVLRSFLSRAVKWELIGRNVAKLVDVPRMNHAEIHPLTIDNARDFLDAARGHRLEHLFTCMLATGLRLGEALGLRWQDVDLATNRIRVRYALERLPKRPWRLIEPKSASSRRLVPLVAPAVEALHAQRARVLASRLLAGSAWREHDFVFPSAFGTPLEPNNVYHEFKEVLRKIAFDRYAATGAPVGATQGRFECWLAEHPEQQRFLQHRLHDLRHTTATYLALAGVPARVRMEILGHSQLSMTIRYEHALPEMLDEAANRLQAVFPSAAATG